MIHPLYPTLSLPTGWRNWPINKLHVSNLNWRKFFSCYNIHAYSRDRHYFRREATRLLLGFVPKSRPITLHTQTVLNLVIYWQTYPNYNVVAILKREKKRQTYKDKLIYPSICLSVCLSILMSWFIIYPKPFLLN